MKLSVRFAAQLALPFLLILLGCIATSKAAQPVLTVAFPSYPPYRIVTPEKTPQGIEAALLTEIAKHMDIQLEFVYPNFRRALYMLQTGEADIMGGLARLPEREAYVQFIEPPYFTSMHKAFYVLKKNHGLITGYDSLQGLRIGTMKGVAYFPRFDADKSLIKDDVSDTSLNYKKLLTERIDTFIESEATGDYHIKRKNLTEHIVKSPYVYSEQLDTYLVLSRTSPFIERLPEFQQVLRKLLHAGFIEEKRKHYCDRCIDFTP